MASVWVGDDVLLSRRVAIKTLHPELALDDGLRARFRREAIAAAKLGHPDIVATYDTGEDDDVAYIVMELVDGPTLRRVIDDHGPLPVAEALRVAREVTAALDHAHRHGVIHRDIKPANVLIPTEGPVKVTDFGIAKATGASDLTRTGTVVGTARYLAPEQVEGGTSDARTDVYAVGLLLYEMLVGHLPFGGDTEMAAAIARVAAAAPAVRTTRPDVDPAVDALVARCLERDPALRYQTAAELAGALDAAGATGGSPLAPAMSSGAIPLASAVAAAAPPAARIASGGDGHAPTTVEARPAPTDPDLPRPAVDRARPRRRRGRGLLVAFLVLVVLGAAGFIAVRALDDSGGSGGGKPNATNANQALRIVSASDFDPFGDDGSEHHEAVGRVFDSDPTTYWFTSTYQSPTMNKPGVGVYVVLNSSTRIRTVDVDTTKAGWNAAIYVADSPGTKLDQWGQPVASGTDLDTHKQFTLDPVKTGKAVLVWLTKLPFSSGPPPGYVLQVTNIRVG
jgi:tRNA A-37 threonylcarbamoyl transferase component Bud32